MTVLILAAASHSVLATTATCPTQITFTGTSTDGVLDSGWTGQGHDSTVISEGTVTVNVTGCVGAAPNCGVCTYSGPVENAAGQLHVQRCEGDSSIECLTNADCGGSAPCVFFFGSYLPLAAGGISTCVQNTFASGIAGTANVNTGSSAGAASLVSRVFTGVTLSNPCPNCVGDGTANDGVQGGTCSSGPRSGLACDASGSSPNISFGTTSLDCPPVPGALIATLPIDLSNTTGTKTRTLTAASPSCRAPGFTTNLCQCDTCNNLAATPCASNADCTAVGATICGGKRCLGGTNAGAPCANNTECPGAGAACAVPGAATAPNQCDGGSGDCVADPGTPSPNDRICMAGPFEQFCSPVETFRGCSSNADCTFAGDTCTFGKNRDCFDNGVMNEVVTATGNPSVPVNHQSDPTLAALFCVGPTSSGSVNSAAGLPGLGRLELEGHSVDNGTGLSDVNILAAKCEAGKYKAVSKKASCLLTLDASAAVKGGSPDPVKVAKCNNSFLAAFNKAEAKGGCINAVDETALEMNTDTFVNDLNTALAVGTPNKCQGAKIKATVKTLICEATIDAKAWLKLGSDDNPDPDVSLCEAKHLASFSKLEVKGGCATTGDASAINAKCIIFQDDWGDENPRDDSPGG